MSYKTVAAMTWLVFLVVLMALGTPVVVSAIMAAVPATIAGAASRSRRASPPSARGTEPLVVTEQPDGWTRIEARPAPLPGNVTAIPVLVGAMAAFGVVAMGGPYHSLGGMLFQGVLTWGVVGGMLLAGIRGQNNGKRNLQTGPFLVRPEAVRLPNGNEVPAGRVYALTLRNGMDGHFSVLVTGSTIGRLSSLGAARHSARLAAIAYRLDLDHDGRSTTLAGGLTEAQARAAAAEVLKRVATIQ